MSAAVELVRVSKFYRDGQRPIAAVRDVSLAIDKAALVALTGPSGSGKTTLLGLMGAMITPSKGNVRLGADEITHLRDHHRAALRRERVGFVFQQLSLIESMSVLENILLPLVPDGGAKSTDIARARALLGDLGLGGREGSAPRSMSGGERQRAAIARALIKDPDLLILDEPTAHLDRESAEGVMTKLVERVQARGTTVAIATHDPRVYEHPAITRVLPVRDGRLERSGGPSAPREVDESE